MLEHSEASSASITMLDRTELHRYQTALAGEYAFPMFGRGSLLSVLVCCAKRSGEAFAPDEIDALRAVAYGVGVALDALERNAGGRIESMLAAVASLRNDVMARLDALVGEGGTVSDDPRE